MELTRRRPDLLVDPWPVFAAALVLAVAGFWPSFFGALPDVPSAHVVHGLSATAWMLLPVAQALLIRMRRRRAHRTLGYLALPLAAVVVVSGLYVVQLMVLRNAEQFEIRRIKFVLLDLSGLALFSVFLGLAIRSARRRDIGLHTRLLVCTALIPLEAALERLLATLFPVLVPDLHVGLYAALYSMEGLCLALIVADWRSGRSRWPFPALLGYYVLMHLIATPVAASPAFQRFCEWYARL